MWRLILLAGLLVSQPEPNATFPTAEASGSYSLGTGDLTVTPTGGPAQCTWDEHGDTCSQRTTDSTGQNRTINASDLYPFATRGSTAPKPLILRGGHDAMQVYVLDGLAACTGADTVSAIYNVDGASATTTTCTYNTAGWCNGGCANATAAATALATCLDAGVGIAATASGAQCPGLGAAADRCVGVTADRLTSGLYLSNNDDTCTVDAGAESDDAGVVVTGGGDATFKSAGIQLGVTGMRITCYSGGEYCALRTPAGTNYGAWWTDYTRANSYLQATTYIQAGTDVFHGDDLNPTVSKVATDAAPVITTITTEEPYAATPPQTTPTNTTGGNLVLVPANGSRRLADSADNDGMCGGAACTAASGTTIITIPTQTDGVVTNCTLTEGAATAAGVIHCNGHTEAECGTSVCAAMTVSPCTLITCAAANNVVSFARVAGSVSYLGSVAVTVGGGSNIVAENGTNGVVMVPDGTENYPGIRTTSEAHGIYRKSSTALGFVIATNERMYLTSSGELYTVGAVVSGGAVGAAAASAHYWAGRTYAYAPADGYLRITDSSGAGPAAYQGYPQTVTCTDNGVGGGNHSTAGCTDIVPISNVIQLVCEDADGCTLSFEETNWSATAAGIVNLIGPAANHIDIADEGGKMETAGGAGITMDALDALCITYAPAAATWVQSCALVSN